MISSSYQAVLGAGEWSSKQGTKLLPYGAYMMLLNSDKYKGERIKPGKGIWDIRVGMRRSVQSKDLQ